MVSSWRPAPGECLLIDSGPTGKHLFLLVIVVEDQVIYVPVCTLRKPERSDLTCVLSVGEHPFLTEESFIEYRNARVDRVDHIAKCVANGYFTAHKPASNEMVEKVREGLLRSAFVKRHIKDLLRNSLG